jgi:hypothetical protein
VVEVVAAQDMMFHKHQEILADLAAVLEEMRQVQLMVEVIHIQEVRQLELLEELLVPNHHQLDGEMLVELQQVHFLHPNLLALVAEVLGEQEMGVLEKDQFQLHFKVRQVVEVVMVELDCNILHLLVL